MEKIQFQELHTPRLRLRKISMEDLPLYYALASSEMVTQYMLWKPHSTVEESVLSIQKAISRYDCADSCRWVIAENYSNQLLGIIDLIPVTDDAAVYTFAYMLREEVWGKGFGTEALQAVLDFAFRKCHASAVQADHFKENIASGAVMRKAGMEYTGTIPGKYEKNGNRYDALVHRITRERWISRQPL